MVWTVAGNIKGPPGPEGPPGPVGPAGLEWKGAWSNATAYVVDDAVGWGGSTYFATAPHAAGANQPPTGTTADPGADDSALNAGWALLATQGAQGPQGIQGIQGIPGIDGTDGTDGDDGGPGPTGPRGTNWYTGTGAPGTIGGSLVGDKYLDLATGDVYTLS